MHFLARKRDNTSSILNVANWENAGLDAVTLSNPTAGVLRITRDSGGAQKPAIRLIGTNATHFRATARLKISGWDPLRADENRWGPGGFISGPGSSLWLAIRKINDSLRIGGWERTSTTTGDSAKAFVSPSTTVGTFTDAWDLEITVQAGNVSYRYKRPLGTTWSTITGNTTTLPSGGVGLVSGRHDAGLVCDVTSFVWEELGTPAAISTDGSFSVSSTTEPGTQTTAAAAGSFEVS